MLSELFEEEEILIEKDEQTIFDKKLEGWENVFGILDRGYGVYRVITKSSNEIQKMQYLPESLSKTFGVIDLYLGGAETTNFSDVKNSEYHIRFENRSVFWSYYFISGPSKSYESVNLFSGKEKLPFSEPEQVILVNGQPALKVTSLEEMPLQQYYTDKQLFAELTEEIIDNSLEVVKRKVNLPTPDVSRLKGKKTNDVETHYSEMYIYL
jgi:hypothetical protein